MIAEESTERRREKGGGRREEGERGYEKKANELKKRGKKEKRC